MVLLSRKLLGFFGLLASSYCLQVLADAPSQEPLPSEPDPWLTGPLLTPTANVTTLGHVNIEPYEYVTTNFGGYDTDWKSHSLEHNVSHVITSSIIRIGVSSKIDFKFVPTWQWNHVHGSAHWTFNDMPFGFDYQVVKRQKGHWWPTVKLGVLGNLPTGKYQKLHLHDHKTDQGGYGSWAPTLQLSMSHLAHISGPVFFAPRWTVQYTFPTPVHVKGLNAYGGGHGTRGKAYPGQLLSAFFGFEFSLPHHWALAGDIKYQHNNKHRFSGHKGTTDGKKNSVGAPSAESFSVAPAVEYNWSANVGVIAGAWFSIAGRNSAEFASAVVAVNIYH